MKYPLSFWKKTIAAAVLAMFFANINASTVFAEEAIAEKTVQGNVSEETAENPSVTDEGKQVENASQDNHSANEQENEKPLLNEEPQEAPDEKRNPSEKEAAEETLTGTEKSYIPGADIRPDPLKNVAGLKGQYETALATGAATYTYPITLPAGRNGLTPSISLRYNSQNRDNFSLAGYGWDLSESYIQRSDRKGTNVMYSLNEFKVAINGGENVVVPVSLSDGAYGEYGEEIAESFWKYLYNSDNTWTLKDKGGTVYTFGDTTDSLQVAPYDSSRIYRWYLREVRDTNDNFIRYTYYQNEDRVYPKEIYYTGNGSSDGIMRVEFGRESRDDALINYRPGFRTVTNYRINTINISISNYGNGNYVRKYSLSYKTGDNTVRSVLSSIQETGWDEAGNNSKTLPETKFSYAKFYVSKFRENTNGDVVDFELVDNSGGDLGNFLMDMNSDGYTDVFASSIVETNYITGGYYGCEQPDEACLFKEETTLFMNNKGIGWNEESGSVHGAAGINLKGEYMEIVDINGDMREDIYRREDRSDNFNNTEYAINTGNAWGENFNGTKLDGKCEGPICYDIGNRMVDINGDGLVDIVQSIDDVLSSSWQEVQINNGRNLWKEDTTWSVPVPLSWPVQTSYTQISQALDSGARFADVNGDGLMDILFGLNYDDEDTDDQIDITYRKIYLNNGTDGWVEEPSYTLPDAFAGIERRYSSNTWAQGLSTPVCLVDMNDDGFSDFGGLLLTGKSWIDGDRGSLECKVAQGSYSAYARKIMEINGDGIPDGIYTTVDEPEKLLLSAGRIADMLIQIDDASGSSITINYGITMQEKTDTGDFAHPNLSLPIRTVSSVVYRDGLGSIMYTSYKYKDGRFYRYDETHREFAGFREVEVSDKAVACGPDASGTLFMFNGGVYVVDCGYLRGVSSVDVFEESGFDWGDVMNIGSSSDWADINSLYQSGIAWDSINHTFYYENQQKPGADFKEKVTKYTFDQGCRDLEPCSSPYYYRGNIITKGGWDLILMDGGYLRNTTYDVLSNLGYSNPQASYDELKYKVLRYNAAVYDRLPYGEPYDETSDSFMYYGYLASYALKGKPTRIETYYKDASGAKTKIAETINTWESSDLGNKRYFPKLLSTATLTYEGGTSHRDTALSYTYDTTTGNVIEEKNWGEVSADASTGAFTNTGSDEVFALTSYTGNTSAWIVGLPFHVTLTDVNRTQKADTTYYYDGLSTLGEVTAGNLTKEEQWLDNTGSYLSTSLTYNSYGLPKTVTNARGYMTRIEWDSNYLYPATITNAQNKVTTFTYNYFNGKLKTSTDPNGAKIQYDYEPFYRVSKTMVSDPASASTLKTKEEYAYTDDSLPSSLEIKRYDGINSTPVLSFYYYDGFKRPIQARIQGEDYYSVQDTAYDEKGQVKKASMAYFDSGGAYETPSWSQSKTENRYDAFGRPLSISFVKSNGSTYGTTTYGYGTPWQAEVTDAKGKMKRFRNDAYGRLKEVDEILSGTTYTTRYSYDTLGSLVTIQDSQGNLRNIGYDSLGRGTWFEDIHTNSDSDYGKWFFTYDSNSNLETMTDANNAVVQYSYDELDRPLSQNLQGGGSDTAISYTYDTGENGIGYVATATAGSKSFVKYDYNFLGIPKKETKTIDGKEFITQFTVDIAGNLRSMVYPDSTLVFSTYNGAGLLETVSVSSPSVSTTPIADIDYSPLGQITYAEYGNSATETYTYDQDEMYRLRSKVTSKGSNKLQNLTYTYDQVGNITTLADASNTPLWKTVNYSYDDLYRLTFAAAYYANSSKNYIQTYSYDAIGNMTSRSGVGTFSYSGTGNANPHATTSVGAYTFTYDRNGNMLTDGLRTLSYNYRNLIEQAVKNGVTTRFTYDHGGNRVLKESSDGKTWYANQFYEERAKGSTEKKYAYIFAGNLRVATIETSVNYDADGDGYTEAAGDCNDSNAGQYPGAIEVCGDGIDQDCSGADLSCNDVDNDGDSYTENGGDCDDAKNTVYPGAAEVCGDGIDQDCSGADLSCSDVDNDGDGYTENAGDCNDSNGTTYPGAAETCGDGVDQDCSGSDLSCNDVDNDGDSYTENGGDCNDAQTTIYPGALETCGDGVDQDCSGADLSCSDVDNDGDGYTENAGDCNDSNNTVYPGATEICGDSIDQNCDGWDLSCNDVDNDGDGYTENGGDCNDTKNTVYPWAAEVCGDGVDQDCSGADLSCSDLDNDGDGYSVNQGDCNDNDSSIKPGATETIGDGVDKNCDGKETCYTDSDKDSYSISTTTSSTDLTCSTSNGLKSTLSNPADCNDSSSSINPGATETTGDGVDKNCDGKETCYLDNDDDTYRPNSTSTYASNDTDCTDTHEATSSDATGDCNDNDASIKPGATETIGDGVDKNCDGKETCYTDSDKDSYSISTTTSSTDLTCSTSNGLKSTLSNPADCNDSSSSINPGATETTGDGVDKNCDGKETCYLDNDDDTYRPNSTSTYASNDTDCTDTHEATSSDATGDCNDNDSSIKPGATEICDSVDNDCDGQTDESEVCGPTCVTPSTPSVAVDTSDSTKVKFTLMSSNATHYCMWKNADWQCQTSNIFNISASDYSWSDSASSKSLTTYFKSQNRCADGTTKETGPYDAKTSFTIYKYMLDKDADNYRPSDSFSYRSKTQSGGYDDYNTLYTNSGSAFDCNDSFSSINPGATEICGDTLDQDCNGSDIACSDMDNDGDGWTETDGDCDDTRKNVNPEETEACFDGLDNDCDGTVDPLFVYDLPSCINYYMDMDWDGYSSLEVIPDLNPTCQCGSTYFWPQTYEQTVAEGADCIDGNSSIHPGASEICGDEIDQDCSGADLPCPDGDGDGWTTSDGDCDDANAAVHPEAVELCGDEIDNDCDGVEGNQDLDADGRISTSCGVFGFDCNDSNAGIYRGKTEICADGIDQDCSGADVKCGDPDNDKDGYREVDGDCDDTNKLIFPGPGAKEKCGDFIDQNCDGYEKVCVEPLPTDILDRVFPEIEKPGGSWSPIGAWSPMGLENLRKAEQWVASLVSMLVILRSPQATEGSQPENTTIIDRAAFTPPPTLGATSPASTDQYSPAEQNSKAGFSTTTVALYYTFGDHLGSSSVTLDASGNLVQATDYFPYGGANVDEKYGSFANPYTYTGKELDSEVDLYYYGARYYNAGFSRFTSVDPALFDSQHLLSILADPQSLNSYAYARNNPIRFIDPNGADAVDFIKGYFNGAWKSVKTIYWGIVNGAWAFLSNPKSTVKQTYAAIVNAIQNYNAVLDAIADEIYNSYDTLAFGSDYESGERAGELITEILAAIVATKGTEYLGKIAKDTSAVKNIISEAKGLKYFDEIVNGVTVTTKENAFDMAKKTLGNDYFEYKPGILRSKDQLIQVRTELSENEIKNGVRPHINVDRLKFQGVKASGESSFGIQDTKHIYYEK